MSTGPRLDHTGLVVADLADAARRMHALGFDLRPQSLHTVSGTGGDLRPAGTANQCAMLGSGYLEIITVVDAAADSFSSRQIGGFLTAFEGLHMLALTVDDAAATEARLRETGVITPVSRLLRRRVDTPAGPKEAQFRLVVASELSDPRIVLFFIEHATPELLWTEGSTRHRNGAVALAEVIIVEADPAARLPLYAAALDHTAESDGDSFRFGLPDGTALIVADVAAAAARCGGALPDRAPPFYAGQAIRVGDLDAVRPILQAAAVPFAEHGGRLAIAPEFACGSWLQFAGAGR